ncbi:hypothetical protein FGW37_02560 [Streptomyces rectiverticillatus]|uniref:hypothetical protein n=1 Tax=Streptomyces rectiverticillatus TaxID=173860 RepID=UPI0015C34C50|nr:hypothetical protein [Streptomyces rectiverticillatus]QLE70636.1 hypothetical protein FGW37_02560 [Streptomyces rectiverticillatus]
MPCDPRPAAAATSPVGTGRRAVLAGAAGLVLGVAGCGTAPPRNTMGSSPPSPAAGLPRPAAWRPAPADIRPDVKLRAVRLVEALGTWGRGAGGTEKARERVRALGLPPALAGQAGPLLSGADEAVVQVIDAQYGGILADSASVLVTCRQWTRKGGGPVVTGGTTVDVRLAQGATAGAPWSVGELHPADPGPAARSLPEAARRVLAERRIRLPAAAEADIRNGGVHAGVLRSMLKLAERYRYDVSIVRSGHPQNVFGTDRPSDHPPGRAFDVWRIDDRAVVDRATPRALIEAFMRDAAASGSYNVGGPVLPAGGSPGRPFFSDDTHHDHVHVGFGS